MLDHITFAVADIGRSQTFYDRALAPLGIAAIVSVSAEQSGSDAFSGYGSAGRAFFWIGGGKPLIGRVHVAFVAESRAQVDAFYAAAIAAGATDNGGPGIRPHYDPDYYGAFVLDPDGHNIEAVCRLPA
jgi:catechol 2,3-dioxygenase-like lactoylglutathione lyase family enzyme